MNKPTDVKDLLFGDMWDYAPAPQGTDFVEIDERYGHFINGEFVVPEDSEFFPSINPATEQPITQIAAASDETVDKAVKAARKAYEKHWKKTSGAERAKYMYRIARMIQEKARELAVIETIDGGKPIRESRDVDVPLAAAHFFYYAGWADKLEYAFPGAQVSSLGVAGQIIP